VDRNRGRSSGPKGAAALRWLAFGSVLLVLFLGQFSFFTLPKAFGGGERLLVNQGLATSVVMFLLVESVLTVGTVRWLFLPQVIKDKVVATPARVCLTSFVFAVAPAVYGVIAVSSTGQGALTLPFSALALIGMAVLYPYTRQVLAALASPRAEPENRSS